MKKYKRLGSPKHKHVGKKEITVIDPVGARCIVPLHPQLDRRAKLIFERIGREKDVFVGKNTLDKILLY
jgi:hypothetical protein